MDLFPELSYDELKDIMDSWLNPETSDSSVDPAISAVNTTGDDDGVAPFAKATAKSAPAVSPTAAKAKAGASDDVSKAFDDLFNS